MWRSRGSCWLLCSVLAFSAVALPCGAQGVSITDATKEQKDAARDAYKGGDKAFAAGKFEAALEKFRASYAIVASPNSRYMIARCLDATGYPVQAYRELEATIEEAEVLAATDDRYAKTAATAKENLAQWRQKLGFVTVEVQGSEGSLTVAGKDIDRAEWGKEIVVEAGTIEVVLSTPAGDERKSVEAVAGSPVSVSIGAGVASAGDEPPPPEEQADDGGISGLRIASYVGFGVGAVGLIGFGVFGGLHLSEYGEIEDACAAGCPPEQSGDADKGRTFQTVANVGLVVGIVGVTAGLGFLIADLVGGDDEEGADSGAGEGADLALGFGPGTATLQGRF